MKTKEELIEFIKTFGKKPGQYTIVELLEIGRMMRTLPRAQIDWPWLHSYLGVYGFSSEAYRLRVFNYIKQHPLPTQEEAESVEYRDDYASKYKAREWYNAYRRNIREEVRIDNLKEEIQLAVSKINELPDIVSDITIPNINGSNEAVLLLSDWHIGQESKNFYNTYNFEVAKNRINKLVEQVIYYCQTQKILHLHILNLGDMVEGIINVSARIEQTMDIIEQIMIASEFLAQFMNTLNSLNINIDYRSCVDNHSRIIADKKQHIEKENLNLLITWYLKERLKNTSIHFVDDNLDNGFGKFNLDNGKNVVFMHGHNDAKSQILQNVIGATHTWIDYIFLGHYHNPATHTFQDMRVFVNGSLCGVGTYALNKRLFTHPSQKFIIFNKNNEDVMDIDILLN